MRAADLEPYITLRYIARLFKVLAVLILLMLVGEIVTGLLIDGSAALLTLIGEGTRLMVMAGLLWAGGDLALLLIDAGHDLRVARILLGRINAQMHVDGAPGRRRRASTSSARRASARSTRILRSPGLVASSVSAATSRARSTFWKRTCAMRSPAAMRTVSAPWFTSTTMTSPR